MEDHTPADLAEQDLEIPPLLLEEDEEIVASPFWEKKRKWTMEENVSRDAILTRWRTGAIDSVTALEALKTFDVLDYDTIMEIISQFYLTLAKVGE